MHRYIRQTSVIGDEGQQLLSNATVMVIGAGGIGCPVLIYLAAAGIGKIIIVDKDNVELSNLHRQVLFNESDISFSKAQKAGEFLEKLNSSIEIEVYATEFNFELSSSLISSVDLIIDGTDNFESRYLINDLCVLNKKPFISCSILKQIVQVSFFDTKIICYRCLYPNPPPSHLIQNCEEAGVLGAVTGLAGTLTANLAINYLIKSDNSNAPILHIFDTQILSLDSLPLVPNTLCFCRKKLKAFPTSIYNHNLNYEITLDEKNRDEYLLVDVRSRAERKIRKLDDDLFFPIEENLSIEFFLNFKEKKIVLYCASGIRSKQFAIELRAQGVNAYFLKDGVF